MIDGYVVSGMVFGGWDVKANPALATMTSAERVEVVSGAAKLVKAGYAFDSIEACMVMDDECGLPEGTADTLYLAENGPRY